MLARLAEARGNYRQNARAEEGENEENRLPVGDHQQIAADHRRDHRRQRHHQRDVGQHLSALLRVELVADDSGSHDAADTAADPL